MQRIRLLGKMLKKNIDFICAVITWIIAINALFWDEYAYLFPWLGDSLFYVLTLLWCVFFYLTLGLWKRKRGYLWLVLLSAPLAFYQWIIFGFLAFIWSRGGFAP